MKAEEIQLLQKNLIGEGFRIGPVDGVPGEKTYAAVEKALKKRVAGLPEDYLDWTPRRKTFAYMQLLCKEHNIEVGKIDGLWGPQTDYAVGVFSHLNQYGVLPPPWRDDVFPDANPNNWPMRDDSKLIAFYGEAGTHQVNVQLPYPHRIAWEPGHVITSFSCHEKVHDSIKRVLQRSLDHYGMDRIGELRLNMWGGCLNVRRERGGTRWSTHAWGIAIDYDPDHNRLEWGRDRAAFAGPEYDPWWRFWGEEGWVSLGRTKNYDWMHVQAARL
jgi:hypothetical protein